MKEKCVIKKRAGWNLLPKAKAPLSIRCLTVSERNTSFDLLGGSKLQLQRLKNTNAKVSQEMALGKENFEKTGPRSASLAADGSQMGEMWRGTSKNKKKAQQTRGESRRKTRKRGKEQKN